MDTFPVPASTRFVVTDDGDRYEVMQATRHGLVEIGSGPTPADAFMSAAEAIRTAGADPDDRAPGGGR